MEKKIERVPYISKWYKEEQKDELLHFDFKDEPMTEEIARELNNCFKNTHVYFDKSADSDCDVDKISVDWLNKDTTSISYPNGIHFWSPQKPQLKFEHYLTQKDVDYLRELLHLVRNDIESIKYVPSKEKYALDRLTIINSYISNSLGVRDKAQEKQLEELIEKSKPQKPYGTLGEHWYELMKLFEIKDFYCLNWKNYFNEVIEIIKENKEDNIRFNSSAKNTYYTVIKIIVASLGIEFIEDFVKACEKCEE